MSNIFINKKRKNFFKKHPEGLLVEVWDKESMNTGIRYVRPVLKRKDIGTALVDVRDDCKKYET